MSAVAAPLVEFPKYPYAPPAAPALAPTGPTRHLRVLVAEDEPVARLRLVRTIERLGHDVLVAADGLEAWELFTQRGADVVVTDWLMPGIDGRELCRRVRADHSLPYTYVIFSTILDREDNVREALLAGADDYLVKPTAAQDIEARLIVAERVTTLHRMRDALAPDVTPLTSLVADTRPRRIQSGSCRWHVLRRCTCSTPVGGWCIDGTRRPNAH
jgi:CheY-like chemotaxis protein